MGLAVTELEYWILSPLVRRGCHDNHLLQNTLSTCSMGGLPNLGDQLFGMDLCEGAKDDSTA
jgi:hypothetical protein